MSKHKHNADDEHLVAHRPNAATRVRNYFLTGLVITGPIGITLWLTWTFIKWVDSWVKPFVPRVYNPETYLPFSIPGFGLIVAVVVLTIVGFLAANFLGRSLISFGERLVDQVAGERAGEAPAPLRTAPVRCPCAARGRREERGGRPAQRGDVGRGRGAAVNQVG